MPEKRYQSLAEFYPYYLSEHRNGACRVLHVVGSTLALGFLVSAIAFARPSLIGAAVLVGYACAWIGHFVFEKNRPATFQYPAYSFTCDWLMYRDVMLGRIPLLGELPERHYLTSE